MQQRGAMRVQLPGCSYLRVQLIDKDDAVIISGLFAPRNPGADGTSTIHYDRSTHSAVWKCSERGASVPLPAEYSFHETGG